MSAKKMLIYSAYYLQGWCDFAAGIKEGDRKSMSPIARKGWTAGFTARRQDSADAA